MLLNVEPKIERILGTLTLEKDLCRGSMSATGFCGSGQGRDAKHVEVCASAPVCDRRKGRRSDRASDGFCIKPAQALSPAQRRRTAS